MAQPTILTVQEVAAYLRLHAVTVYRMAQNGVLPAFRVGRRWRFKRDQIEQWVAGHQTANSVAAGHPPAGHPPASGSPAGGHPTGPANSRARTERPRTGRK